MAFVMRISYHYCMIEFRPLTQLDEFEQVSDLEILIWGLADRYVLAPTTLKVIVHTGGCLIGAFSDGLMVGFVMGLARRDGRLWSHIAGVHPDFQRQSIGYQLKQAQFQWAKENDFTHMHWTYDPLLRGNAHFNLRRVGAYVEVYRPNFYGQMADGINAGLPSDRMQVTWNITHPQSKPTPPMDDTIPFLLEAGADGQPIINGKPHAKWHRVQVPSDVEALKQQNMSLALAWRMALREVLMGAFEQGYQAIDFLKADKKNYYYLVLPDV